MNLQQTVTKITGKDVTEDEAMAFARDNFGILTAYVKAELSAENKDLKEQLEIAELERERIEQENENFDGLLSSALMYVPESNELHTKILEVFRIGGNG